MKTAPNRGPTTADAEARLLSLKMACNSIRLAQEVRLARNPSQLQLHHRRLKSIAADEAKRPFDKRTDLVRPRISISAMNEAYSQLMREFAYESAEVRDHASRRLIGWIATTTQPRMEARDIVRQAIAEGALKA